MKWTKAVIPGLVIWVGLFVYSFYSTRGVEPTGDGFTRGLNRVEIFMSWHLPAIALAIVLVIVGWRVEHKGRRWLSRLPLIIHLLSIVGLFGTAIYTYQSEKAAALKAHEEQMRKETTP